MVQKILAAVDGTPASESVLPYLESLLHCQDANVTFVRVVPQATAGRVHRAFVYLNQLSAGLARKGAVVDTHVLSGHPAPLIVDLAARGNYDLIVMCSRGKTGLKKLLMGSVAEEVMHQSAVPVLAVHPLPKDATAPQIRKILVPLDGSHRSGSILPPVATLAKATGAKLVFTTVVEPHSKVDYPVEVVAKNLFKEQKELHRVGIQTELCIRFGDPAAEILALADTMNVDLIALSTHGRTGLERVRYGSVAESILRKGTPPLLVLRTAGKFIPDPIHAPEIRARRQRQRQQDAAAAATR
jgi:nucleotide-binding universal stress UspA family protein